MPPLSTPTSRPSPGDFEPPAPGAPPASTTPAAPSSKNATSPVAGLIALVAGAITIAGTLLQWGKGTVTSAAGAEKAIIEVAGFDSNGFIALACGAGLLLAGVLFFMGVPKQLNWAILAFVAGAVIVGAVVFSVIDISDLSNRYAAEWQQLGLAATGDVITTQADIGLWVTGLGGVLGVLAAPFANRV